MPIPHGNILLRERSVRYLTAALIHHRPLWRYPLQHTPAEIRNLRLSPKLLVIGINSPVKSDQRHHSRTIHTMLFRRHQPFAIPKGIQDTNKGRPLTGEIMKVQQVDESGKQCLKNVIEEVAAYSRKHGHAADAEEIALRLWTFVHGASSLQLDGDYERVAPGLDVHELITDVTPMLLGVTPDKRALSRGRKR